jgi:hypothetical protein
MVRLDRQPMERGMRRLSGWLAALLLLAGCGADSIVATTDGQPLLQGERSMLVSGPRVVEVFGSPPDRSSPQALADLLRFPGFANERPFEAVPQTGQGPRLVAVYGRSRGRPCVAPQGAAVDMPMQLTMAFCRNAAQISLATMQSETLVGPSDPGFAGALDRMMLALIRSEPRRLFDN